MGHSEDLHQFDDQALRSLHVLGHMPPESQERLLRHLFRVVAEVDATDDREAALQLCKELASTVRMHGHETYHKATLAMTPSDGSVSIEDMLARLK